MAAEPFGPVEVVVNGVRYTRETTLFAAMDENTRLRTVLQTRDRQLAKALDFKQYWWEKCVAAINRAQAAEGRARG